jgi:hypothetical protein
MLTPKTISRKFLLPLASISIFLASACSSHDMPSYKAGEHLQIDQASIKVEERSKGFETAAQAHFESTGSLLYMSWFPNTLNEMYVDISSNGTGAHGEILKGVSHVSQVAIALKPEELAEVKQLLTQLPSFPDAIDQVQIVLISYTDSQGWHTRGYDRSNLPAPVKRLYELTQAPLPD